MVISGWVAISVYQVIILLYLENVDGGQLCMKCSHVVRPQDCGAVQQCGEHEQCYIRRYMTDSGITWFDVGCAPEVKCQGIASSGIGRRQELGETTVCEHCCNDSAICNTKPVCGAPGIHSDGPVCFSCQDEQTPNRCDRITMCYPHEKCILQSKIHSFSHTYQWSSGCASEQKCQSLQQFQSQGKLSNFCCDTVLCNSHLVLAYPKECSDIKTTTSGVYTIYPYGSSKPTQVYCEVDSSGFVWTVIQKRFDGSLDFYRNWTEYKNGFGIPNAEYWLGNDIIHLISVNGSHELKIVMSDWEGVTKYAQYGTFSIDSEQNYYRLHSGNYSGNAGDALYNNFFSTYDIDRDTYRVGSCAKMFNGAWWYVSCHCSNLNGKYYHGNHTSYATGIEWCKWHGYYYSLKETMMMIKRT